MRLMQLRKLMKNTRMLLKKCKFNFFIERNIKNDLKRSFFVYYSATLFVAFFSLIYLFFYEDGQGFNCIYKTVYNKECVTCGLTRDLHAIFIKQKITIINPNSVFYAILLMVNLFTRPLMILIYKKVFLRVLVLIEFLILIFVFLLFVFISS